MKNFTLTKPLDFRKTLTTAALFACTLTLPLLSYAKETTYICYISLPQNPTQTVTASSASEAAEKVKKDIADTAKRIYGMTSVDVSCIEEK
ncbi:MULTISPECIES: hypothetical protein [Pseudomonas]|uniref:Uncharacterized protein n=1 Tax=Pseudomonas gessardii TaxID=78544 RepID=A0A7Y1QLH8_9PSED|nr:MULTISPECIES: hypothetical protein [Pseudomonas]MBH3424679.1 hypothetical protein [Pseudomonas gessardii]MRU51597.1 hypothetical protein [Pseudomonas gessardii]NNA89839.1 hypothetical protein [Pseudomonas gessardii]NNA94788.1 hypothetical protein [Pseudomonas gessardii]